VSVVDTISWNEKAGLRPGCGVRSQVIDVLKAQIKRGPAMKKVSTAATVGSRNISQQGDSGNSAGEKPLSQKANKNIRLTPKVMSQACLICSRFYGDLSEMFYRQ
jgi:hypothetical protein